MSNTDTTTTAAASSSTAAAPATSSFLVSLETTLSAEWQGAANFLTEAETFFGSFLTKVAAGAEILITDIEQAGQYVAGHLTAITAGISAVGAVAASVAPNNATVTKVIADLQTGAQDVATLSNSLQSGSTSGDPTVVNTAVTAINAVKQLSQLVSTAGATLTTLASNSPTATQAVTAAAPGATAAAAS